MVGFCSEVTLGAWVFVSNCLFSDYETLLKSYHKAQQVVEQEGVPNFFVRALVALEAFVEEKHKDKESFKKLSRPKALALNTLRAKVRKTTEPWAASIADCIENPEKFETQSEESDEVDVSCYLRGHVAERFPFVDLLPWPSGKAARRIGIA